MEMMQRIEYHGTVSLNIFIRAQRLHMGKRRAILWLFPVMMTGWAWSKSSGSSFILLPIT